MGCIGEYGLPFCGLYFYFVDDFLCSAKTFQFDVVPFIYFFSFVFFALGDISNKKLLCVLSEILLPMFSPKDFYGSGSNI